MFLVIAISFPVGGCSLLRTRAAGSSFPMTSEAREDSVGTDPASSVEMEAAAGAGFERRDEAATASISLKLRLSLTRSDKLLTVNKIKDDDDDEVLEKLEAETKQQMFYLNNCVRILTELLPPPSYLSSKKVQSSKDNGGIIFSFVRRPKAEDAK